ncbi:MAG TPA: SPOR domain-containing protein [Pseudolabrys sp.]|nr:SPOR domain-containing protein [Pseudolabrys sp.]
MADDQSQRPYRASEPPPARGSGKTPGSDPLAELARLIGQTDPFGEYGRETARRSPPSQSVARPDWNQPLGAPYTAQYSGDTRAPEPAPRYADDGHHAYPPAPASPLFPQDYDSQNYERQPYEVQPHPGGTDQYEAEQGAHRFPLGQSDYQQDFYDEAPVEDEYYEDARPPRRRMVVMAIAGVAALAVIGTAGAFGYRALVGSSGSSAKPPPVIKADTTPSKIVPATTGKDTQSNKLITDRVNERGQSEKLVSREEQPLDRPTATALSQSGPQVALGSGVIGSEPKKVRTIAIHPDQPVADAAPSSMSAAAPARAAPAAAPRVAVAPPRPAPDTTADAEESAPAAPTRPAPAQRQAAHASGNAPLSLNPNGAPSRAAPAPAPARTAAVAPQAPAAASTGGPGSYVQVSSQRSEGEAQAAFRSLQAKFPDQLGGREPYIHKVDLGAKGTYYRAMVGPFANAGEASQLCSSLKAAGGQCLIQRN